MMTPVATEKVDMTTISSPSPEVPVVDRQHVTATVVLPCYNEEGHVVAEIERITEALDADGMPYELLVIDDASTDGTLAAVRAVAHRFPWMRVIARRRNGGSGTVRRLGTHEAKGEVVVWTDADMTYPNERIPELVRLLLDDDAHDQVVGARTSEQGTHRWARIPAKWTIRRFAEFLTGARIPDLNSGLRAFRREVALPYLRLLPAGFSCVTTITIAFLANGHEIRYVPIDYSQRAGRSKFSIFKDAYRYILQVLRMVMYFDPLRVLMPVALTLFGVGMVKLVVDQFRNLFYLPANTVLLIIAGLIVGSMALLADLVVRSREPS
jgi:glycosyltransferase involved in cell wall biosynthesis